MSHEPGAFARALAFLEALDSAKIWYRLEHVRESLMVIVAIPDERWEVEFFEDGHVEIERFTSQGITDDAGLLDMLLQSGQGSD